MWVCITCLIFIGILFKEEVLSFDTNKGSQLVSDVCGYGRLYGITLKHSVKKWCSKTVSKPKTRPVLQSPKKDEDFKS